MRLRLGPIAATSIVIGSIMFAPAAHASTEIVLGPHSGAYLQVDERTGAMHVVRTVRAEEAPAVVPGNCYTDELNYAPSYDPNGAVVDAKAVFFSAHFIYSSSGASVRPDPSQTYISNELSRTIVVSTDRWQSDAAVYHGPVGSLVGGGTLDWQLSDTWLKVADNPRWVFRFYYASRPGVRGGAVNHACDL